MTLSSKPLIIITTMNQLATTINCIESLLRHSGVPLDLMIVDGASTDGTPTYLESHYNCQVIRMDKPYWVSKAWNVAREAALETDAEHIGILNNDLLFYPNWLPYIVETFNNPPDDMPVGIVGPSVLDTNGEIQSQGEIYIPPGKWFQPTVFKDMRLPVLSIGGACMLFSRDALQSIGSFDERLIFEWDEVDYCMRAWDAGFQVIVRTIAAVVHLGGVTKHAINWNWRKVVEDYGLPVISPTDAFLSSHPFEDTHRIWNDYIKPLHDKYGLNIVESSKHQ